MPPLLLLLVGTARGVDAREQPRPRHEIVPQVAFDETRAALDGALERCRTLVANLVALKEQALEASGARGVGDIYRRRVGDRIVLQLQRRQPRAATQGRRQLLAADIRGADAIEAERCEALGLLYAGGERSHTRIAYCLIPAELKGGEIGVAAECSREERHIGRLQPDTPELERLQLVGAQGGEDLLQFVLC